MGGQVTARLRRKAPRALCEAGIDRLTNFQPRPDFGILCGLPHGSRYKVNLPLFAVLGTIVAACGGSTKPAVPPRQLVVVVSCLIDLEGAPSDCRVESPKSYPKGAKVVALVQSTQVFPVVWRNGERVVARISIPVKVTDHNDD